MFEKKKCSSIDLIYLELQTLPGQAVSHHMWELFYVLKRTVEAGKMWQTTPMRIIITKFVIGPTNLKNIGILKLIPNLTCGICIFNSHNLRGKFSQFRQNAAYLGETSRNSIYSPI